MCRLAYAVIVALAWTAAGCATTQAKGDAAGPALVSPTPPPHYVTPVEVAAAEPATPAEPGPTPVIVRPSPRPPAPRAERRTEKPVERTDTGAAAAQPPSGAVSPPLQTTANVVELERGVRARMTQALRDLERTDYRLLSADRRTQYDTARRFVQQAEEALKERNLVFAEQLADKAATLAAALVRR